MREETRYGLVLCADDSGCAVVRFRYVPTAQQHDVDAEADLCDGKGFQSPEPGSIPGSVSSNRGAVMANRNREELQKQFEEQGKTKYVTTEMVEAEIESSQFHHFRDTTVTVCCLTLKNGFTVVGKSACANPKNFEVMLGQQLAYDDEKQQVYSYLGFRLCDEMSY